MRAALAIVPSSLLIILAGQLATESGWWLAFLGIAAIWLLWAVGEKARRVERHGDRREFWSDVMITLQETGEPSQPNGPSSQD